MTNERIQSFYSLAKKIVKKHFRKRKVAKLSFNEKELQEIKELKRFLEDVLIDNREEIEKYFDETRKLYFCVSIKVTVGELSTFVNHYFSIEDFKYARDELYIPKAIYSISKNRHCELFFCTSLLKTTRNCHGFSSVERRGENAYMSSIVFVDLDLPQELSILENDELLERLLDAYGNLFSLLGCKIIRSGGGIHIYFGISSILIHNEEAIKKWDTIILKLSLIFREWGSDSKCKDRVRLLRIPFGFNRKNKYGIQGKEVKILYDDYRTNDISVVLRMIDYWISMQKLQSDILEGIIPSNDVGYYDEGFVFLGDIGLDVFGDVEVEKCSNEEDCSKQIGDTSECSNVMPKAIVRQNKGDYFSSYKGVVCAYDEMKCDKDYRIRDICFFLNNRSSSEGIRHTSMWFLIYSYYNFLMIRDYEELKQKMIVINENYFKPRMSSYEFEYSYNDCFKSISKAKFRNKNIRNEVIKDTYKPSMEELELVRGNYYTKGTKEFEMKEKKEHARRTREYRKRKHQ